MSFSKNDLDKIKSKISIRSELEKKSKLIQKGNDFWCCCPFHDEKTPSCKINEDPGSFYCFGCGAKGDIFTIYTDLYNYTFIDAVKELSQQAGVEINFEIKQINKGDDKIQEILDLSTIWFQNNLDNSLATNCNEYLKKRNLNKKTVEKFKLGYSSNSDTTLYDFLKKKGFDDKDLLESNIVKLDKSKKIRDFFYKRLIFPIISIRGKVVGFGGRALDDSNPKYINSPESKFFQKRHLLYNLNIAKNSARKKNNLLICEGYMDVISLNQNGILSVVAPLGTALTEDQLKLTWRYSSRPTIMFDGDNAGLRASYKSAIMSLSLISPKNFLQFINLPYGYDPDSYINEINLDKFIQQLKKPIPLTEFIFNESIKSFSFEKVDEKISYDKYLDDLADTIKDKKSQYFYRSEFKSLFFNKIRNKNKHKNKNLDNFSVKKLNINLGKKQNFSFLAVAINHQSVRSEVIECLLSSKLIDLKESDFVNELKKNDNIGLDTAKIIKKFSNSDFDYLIKESISIDISQLFPYSRPSFDPQESLEEVLKSVKNLNTRLSYLKKINKSLNNFENESNQLNWDDLLTINLEILDEDL